MENIDYINEETFPRRPIYSRVRAPAQEKKEHISNPMAVMLVSVALFIDGFQALLNLLIIGEVASSVISVCSNVLFMVWFWMLGMGIIKNPRKLGAMLAQSIIGLIPILNTLPELTMAIVAIIIVTKAEDRGISVSSFLGIS